MEETQVDEHEEFLNEYIPRQFAPDTAAWLYRSGDVVLTRKIPSPEDTGIDGELLGI